MRKQLKIEFAAWGITRCELRLPGCWLNTALGFAHAAKRRKLSPADLYQVILADNHCHDIIERLPPERMKRIVEGIISLRKARLMEKFIHQLQLPRVPSLLLHGGGFDSSALLAVLVHKQVPTTVFHIQYGQKAAIGEAKSIIYFCRKYKVAFKLLHLPLHEIASSSILSSDELPAGCDATKNKLEGRNVIFMALAATYASTIGASNVYLGFHQEPNETPFPDATKEAAWAMEKAFQTVYTSAPVLSIPFASLPRADILRIAQKLDPEILYRAHTCYESSAGHCGHCAHCVKRSEMFAELELEVPTEREEVPK